MLVSLHGDALTMTVRCGNTSLPDLTTAAEGTFKSQDCGTAYTKQSFWAPPSPRTAKAALLLGWHGSHTDHM